MGESRSATAFLRRGPEPITDLATAVPEALEAQGCVRSSGRRDDKIQETCWFCGGRFSADLRDPASGVAMLMIEGLGGGGEAIQGVCHSACAERAKGSLSPDGF